MASISESGSVDTSVLLGSGARCSRRAVARHFQTVRPPAPEGHRRFGQMTRPSRTAMLVRLVLSDKKSAAIGRHSVSACALLLMDRFSFAGIISCFTSQPVFERRVVWSGDRTVDFVSNRLYRASHGSIPAGSAGCIRPREASTALQRRAARRLLSSNRRDREEL